MNITSACSIVMITRFIKKIKKIAFGNKEHTTDYKMGVSVLKFTHVNQVPYQNRMQTARNQVSAHPRI